MGLINKAWDWFIGKASIRKKLIISYFTLTMIPLAVLGFYSFNISRNNLLQQTEETMNNNLSRIVIEMNGRIKREEEFNKYLAYNLELRETLEETPDNRVKIAQTLNTSLEPALWYYIASDSNIKQIEIITPAVNIRTGAFLIPAGEYEEKAWYQKHRTHFNTLWSVEDGRLFSTRTILDTRTASEMTGILRTEFFPDSILEPVSSMDYLDNGIILTDNAGNIIYEKEIAGRAVMQQVHAQLGQVLMGDSKNTKTYLLSTSWIQGTGWKLYYYIDRAVIAKQVNRIIMSTLVMVLFCIALVFGCISILSKALGGRLLVLKAEAERVSGGDLTHPYYTGDTDEIGVVINSFAAMTERLDKTINQVYKIEIEKKASELKALRAMINPHFLYNSLSAIKWKALKKGDDEIGNAAGLLAKFYRTALNNGDTLTTVAGELENIRTYVEIQQITRRGCFDAEYRIAQECLDSGMLNFLLQPIVENAIMHGIDYVEEDSARGKVLIEFYPEDGYLYFNIYNNGPLPDLKELERILKTPGKGYGINNIQERIRMYYGCGCGLSATITEEGLVCFTVKILKLAENAEQG